MRSWGDDRLGAPPLGLEEQGGGALSPTSLGCHQEEPRPRGSLPFSALPGLVLRAYLEPKVLGQGQPGRLTHPGVFAPSRSASPFQKLCILKVVSG